MPSTKQRSRGKPVATAKRASVWPYPIDRLCLASYLKEECPGCHKTFDTIDDLMDAVWWPWSNGHVGHKACYQANAKRSEPVALAASPGSAWPAGWRGVRRGKVRPGDRLLDVSRAQWVVAEAADVGACVTGFHEVIRRGEATRAGENQKGQRPAE